MVKIHFKIYYKRDNKSQIQFKNSYIKKLISGVNNILITFLGIFVEEIFIKDMTMSKELQRDLSMTSKT